MVSDCEADDVPDLLRVCEPEPDGDALSVWLGVPSPEGDAVAEVVIERVCVSVADNVDDGVPDTERD